MTGALFTGLFASLAAPSPSYQITASASTINEGAAVTYTVTTTNVPNGTTLYYTNSGTATGDDFAGGFDYGFVNIVNNTATFTLTATEDVLLEGNQTLILSLRTDGYSGTVVATAGTVTVADTSFPTTTTTTTTSTTTTTQDPWSTVELMPAVRFSVVAGGGGGGFDGGGGGGGGGTRAAGGSIGGISIGGIESVYTNLYTGTDYAVTVGAGGAQSTNGSNSTFHTITSTGGGAGGGNGGSGANGGSGGGSGRDRGSSTAYGLGTTNQGVRGGSTPGSAWASASGGGGSTGVGGNGSANGTTDNDGGNGGAGGPGRVYYATGSARTYSGGGGGSSQTRPGGAGGSGVGGAGANGFNAPGGYSCAGSGLANTGGGGGGGGSGGGSCPNGGNGGSGEVVIAVQTYNTTTSTYRFVGAQFSAGITAVAGTWPTGSVSHDFWIVTSGTGTVRFRYL